MKEFFFVFIGFLNLVLQVTEGLPTLSGQTLSIDIGSSTDLTSKSTTSGSCSISITTTGSSFSVIQTANSRTYRTIPEDTQVEFACNVSGFDLSATGVPYVDAIFDVVYRDDRDENACSDCHDLVYTKMSYGSKTWFSVMGFGGLADGIWKTENVLFGSSPWQMIRAINGIITLAIKSSSISTSLALDSLSLRFLTHPNFISERETIRASKSLIRKDYLDGNFTTPPSRPTSGQPFALFSRNYLEKIYENTIPLSSEISYSGSLDVSVQEIKGEIEPVSICVFAFDSLTNVTLELNGGISSTIAEIEAFEILIEDRRWVYAEDKYYGKNPWTLRPLKFPLDSSSLSLGNWERAWSEINIKAGSTKQFWLNIKVKTAATAGVYTEQVSICGTHSSSSRTCKIATISLTVIEITLGNPKTTTYLYRSPWYWSFDWGGSDKSHVIADQSAHGPLADNFVLHITISNWIISYFSLTNEANSLMTAGIWADENNHVRVHISDNWRDMWELEYGNSNYFQQDSTNFDVKYKKLLQNYSNYISSFGSVIPEFEFEDEPGVDISRRLHTTHMNRLSHELGIKTWTTYYPSCEKPLGGYHEFVFTAPTLPEMKNELPDWIKNDPTVRCFYDFNQANGLNYVTDKSSNGNTGFFYNGATVTNNVLEVTESNLMFVEHNKTLNLETSGTIIVSMRVDAVATGYADFVISKGSSEFNYLLYMYAAYGPNDMGMYATDSENNNLVGIPGIDTDMKMPYTSTWHQFLWTYDNNTGGMMFLDHIASGPKNSRYKMKTNTNRLYLGRISGGIDNFIMLGRSLSTSEQLSLTSPKQNYTCSITATATTTTTTIPTTIRFSIMSKLANLPTLTSQGTIRKLYVNNNLVWSKIGQEFDAENYKVEIGSYVVSGQQTTFKFEVTSGRKYSEDFQIYFVDNVIRNLVWTESGMDSGWSHSVSSTTDLLGDYAPVSWYLDQAVIIVYWSGETMYKQIRHLGMTPSLYSTYPATQPVPIYNRFIGGLWSAAIGGASVSVYCYMDWTSDPWDEESPRDTDSFIDLSLQYHSSYSLVAPSWDKMLYDFIPFEMVREGTEDSRIFALLEQEILTHSGIAISNEASNWLNNLYSLPTKHYSYYAEIRSSKPIQYYGDTSDRILSDLTGSETEYSFFEQTRSKAIDYIQKLQNSQSCTPKTCKTMNHNCGTWDDGCGTDLNCGNCTSPFSCSISTGLCACIPQTCNSLGYLCGTPLDGCGNILSCGSCTLPETCYYGNCSTNACTPQTCASLGLECDSAQDGCGNGLNCGSCSSLSPSKTCVNGKCKDKSVSSSDNNNVNHSNKVSINSIAIIVIIITSLLF